MAQKISVINSMPMEMPGIEGVSVAKVLKWQCGDGELNAKFFCSSPARQGREKFV